MATDENNNILELQADTSRTTLRRELYIQVASSCSALIQAQQIVKQTPILNEADKRAILFALEMAATKSRDARSLVSDVLADVDD
jgi:hypothetical protein